MRTTCSALAAAATVALLAAACGGTHDETEGAYDAAIETSEQALTTKRPLYAKVAPAPLARLQPNGQTASYANDDTEEVYMVNTTTGRMAEHLNNLAGRIVGMAQSATEKYFRMEPGDRIEVTDLAGNPIRTFHLRGFGASCGTGTTRPAGGGCPGGARDADCFEPPVDYLAIPGNECGMAYDAASDTLIVDDHREIHVADMAGVSVQSFTLPASVTDVGGLGYNEQTGWVWALHAPAANNAPNAPNQLSEMDLRGGLLRTIFAPANVQLTAFDIDPTNGEMALVHEAGSQAVIADANGTAPRFMPLRPIGGELGGASVSF